MKSWRTMAGGISVILFAYIYAYFTQEPPHFNIETFCMVIILISFIAGFFWLLCRLFSR